MGQSESQQLQQEQQKKSENNRQKKMDMDMDMHDNVQDEPPKPISSDEEDSDAPPKRSAKTATPQTMVASKPIANGSRLFAPYRTLGILSNGRPFHLVPHDHSGNAMVALPMGDRFQLVRTDHLRPVMVSQAVPAPVRSQQEISHLVTDSTLSITVVAHGRRPVAAARSGSTPTILSNQLTLYQRTKPIDSKRLVPRSKNSKNSNDSNDWYVKSLLHLGRIKVPMSGEKEGKLENATVVAAILGRLITEDHDGKGDAVPVVGSDDEDHDEDNDKSDDEDGASSLNSSDDEDDHDNDDDESHGSRYNCQVVIVIASRQSLRIQKRIRFVEPDLTQFTPVAAVHPSTYLNKIVLGGFDASNGQAAMVLLNVRSGKIVHRFQCVSDASSQITNLTQSPAIDTVAVGTSQGMVHLVNLKHDKTLFSLEHKTQSGHKPVLISSICFRTDTSALKYATAPMAVGRADGTITIWDLTTPQDPSMGRSILCEMPRVHTPGGIAKLQFLPQEPLLISTGTGSNSIVMHIFDNPDHSGRILRQRQGHTAPPRTIQYLHPGTGAGGGVLANASDGTDVAACQILSTGGPDRTLRVFSTARTASDKAYGQGRGLVKKAKRLGLESITELLLPPVAGLTTCEARSRDWGDLVTIHEDHAFAYVWSTTRGAQSGPILRQESWNVSAMKAPPPSHTHATSVAISACGNFALVGSRGGKIYKYNIQSGIPRGTFPRDDEKSDKSKKGFIPGDISHAVKVLEKSRKISSRAANIDQMELDAEQKSKQDQRLQKKAKEASHLGAAVTGIAVDAINRTVVSVGSDGKLILWNLVLHSAHTKSPHRLPAPATRLSLVRDSGLAAVALCDYSVLMFDILTQSVIRRFGTAGSLNVHQGPISDLGFSPDGRSLYTSSLDSTIRVWDVPTDTCVDWLAFKTPPTSITVSPTGEFIATAHTGSLGLSVWSDRSFYETVYTDGEVPKEPFKMDEPTPLSDTWDPVETKHATGKRQLPPLDESPEDDTDSIPVPKEEGLVTLSGLAPSHWKNLFSLELVKERNKPIEAPKKPPSAPFFLQWRSGEAVEPEAQETEDKNDEDGAEPDDWAAAWSDEDDDEDDNSSSAPATKDKRAGDNIGVDGKPTESKRRKVSHSRSHVASLLQQCNNLSDIETDGKRYSLVTDYITTLGPSAIDVALSTLCTGQHDEDGILLLRMAAEWLLEEIRSRAGYETTNAYLHRFLHLHASVIANIDESDSFSEEAQPTDGDTNVEERKLLVDVLTELRRAQHVASNELRSKMQRATCLLKHFSRMV